MTAMSIFLKIQEIWGVELKVRLQGSMTPDITGPAVETSSQRIGKADGNWDALDSKILEHLVRKKCCVSKEFCS